MLKRAGFDLVRRASNAIFGPGITHRSSIVRGVVAAYRHLHETIDPAHRRQRAFHRDNPEAPWLVPDAIPFIEGLIAPGAKVFEFGAGNSTVWFARMGAQVHSVEGRPEWGKIVAERLTRDRLESQVTLTVAAVTDDFNTAPEEIARYVSVIDAFAPGTFDAVLVDGHFRVACLERSFDKVREGGYLILDNSDVADVADLTRRLKPYLVRHFENGIWRTSVYRAPQGGIRP